MIVSHRHDGPAEVDGPMVGDGLSRDEARRALIARRNDLPEPVRNAKDLLIGEHVRSLVREALRGRPTPWRIGGYWPIKNEPDLRPLFHEWTRDGHRIGLPLVDRVARPLTFVLWKPHSAMAPGYLGVPVPTSGASVQVDLLLVPCVGFAIAADRSKHRLGYGGGYYDRTLAARRFKAIGIAYESMRLAHFEPGGHDAPLDFIVTEDGIR